MCLEGKCGLLVIATLKCPDSYLEISFLQIKGHFYCTDSSVGVTATENICSAVPIVKLAIELHLEDACRQSNDRCRSIQSGFSLWDAGQDHTRCLFVSSCKERGSHLQLQDSLVCLQPKMGAVIYSGVQESSKHVHLLQIPMWAHPCLWEHQTYFRPPPSVHLLPLMNF